MLPLAALWIIAIYFPKIEGNELKNFIITYDIVEPVEPPKQICHRDDACYYGYVKVNSESTSAIFKALPTW